MATIATIARDVDQREETNEQANYANKWLVAV